MVQELLNNGTKVNTANKDVFTPLYVARQKGHIKVVRELLNNGVTVNTANKRSCTVLTLCDGQLAMPASNCTLCGYVLEYYSALFVWLSQLMFVILPYIYC